MARDKSKLKGSLTDEGSYPGLQTLGTFCLNINNKK